MKHLATVFTYPPLNGYGAIGNPTRGGPAMLETVITTLISLFTILAGLWFIIQIFIGTFNWISAGSDKSALERSQKRITNAVIGLFLVIFAYGFIAIAGLVLGLNILNPAATISNLKL